MPVTDSSAKALRRDKKRTKVNRRRKDAMKDAINEVESLLEEGNVDAAEQALSKAQKTIDKAAQDGVIHENRAARKKSQLARKVAEAQS
jgi:small subunit ribosomal protein S20